MKDLVTNSEYSMWINLNIYILFLKTFKSDPASLSTPATKSNILSSGTASEQNLLSCQVSSFESYNFTGLYWSKKSMVHLSDTHF
jgi:hypothetical protein